LVPDPSLEHRFEQGLEGGVVGRERLPEGSFIDPHQETFENRVALTEEALARGSERAYEGCFLADEVFVAVDVLEQRPGSVCIVEVKSTTKIKPEHIPDVAIQAHVLRSLAAPGA
jgi:hypothetical protein